MTENKKNTISENIKEYARKFNETSDYLNRLVNRMPLVELLELLEAQDGDCGLSLMLTLERQLKAFEATVRSLEKEYGMGEIMRRADMGEL